MHFIKKITLVALVLFLYGCNSLMTDIFVGNIPTEEDSWYKKDMTQKTKINDFDECYRAAEYKYNKTEQFEERHRLNQECLLGKGYKFYPRGLDGSKASRCTAGGDGDGPACQSLKNIRNR